MRCSVDNCTKSYASVAAIKTHYYRCHGTKNAVMESISDQVVDNYFLDNSDAEAEGDEQVCVANGINITAELRRRCSLLLLELQEKHKLPQSVRGTVHKSLKSLLSNFGSSYSNLISFHLQQAGFSLDEHLNVKELLCTDFIDQAIGNLDSQYELLQYCKTSLGMIEPEEKYLNNDNRDLGSFQYVSIIKVLKFVLSQEDIFDVIMARQASDPGCLCDFNDGSVFENHEFFNSDSTKLRIHLYTDEFEVVNPLGSRKSVHKVMGFYFFLGNMHPKYRTHLRHIYLTILVKSSLLSNHETYNTTTERILEPLIVDLKTLAVDGIDVEMHGHIVHFTGALATISANNLGAHKLAGFQACFSSGLICRQCMVIKADMPNHLSADSLVLRTPYAHDKMQQAACPKNVWCRWSMSFHGTELF